MPPKWAVHAAGRKDGKSVCGKKRRHIIPVPSALEWFKVSCGFCQRFNPHNKKWCRKGEHRATPENTYIRKGGFKGCLPCRRENANARYIKYREKKSAYCKAYYLRNKDYVQAKNARWRQKNAKRYCEVQRIYRLRRKDDISEGEVAHLIELTQKWRRPVAQA